MIFRFNVAAMYFKVLFELFYVFKNIMYSKYPNGYSQNTLISSKNEQIPNPVLLSLIIMLYV